MLKMPYGGMKPTIQSDKYIVTEGELERKQSS